MRNLPIAIQTFSELRSRDCIYIDKTEHIHRLLTTNKAYFFSRPRRFGKSMTLSTIKSIYKGEKHYFEGLWIENHWDWTRRNPIIHIPFSSLGYNSIGLVPALELFLRKQAANHNIVLEATSYILLFEELIRKLCEKDGKVVILIDEYDKPIIDHLEKENIERGKENRAILREFYSIIKDADEYIEFFFMTGVSKFSQTGIFSHLNHLDDISLNEKYIDLVGYTQTELEDNFGEYIDYALEKFTRYSREELLQNIKLWYNGYSWDAKNSVYNPYSVLNFFNQRIFEDFWFKTGSPRFLILMLQELGMFNLNEMKASGSMISSYDLEDLNIRALLFQTGYLTIKEMDIYTASYVLDYPNKEVELAMTENIIAKWIGGETTQVRAPVLDIQSAFLKNKIEKVIWIINSLFKDVPFPLLKGKKEDFYHAIIHLHFKYLGMMNMDSEVCTSDGRMDAVVKTATHIYILEFKINKSAEIALQQIKDKAYPEKYLIENKEIVMIGINFDTRKKGIKDWLLEVYK